MREKRRLPDGLRATSGRRTDHAVVALHAALEMIETELAQNGYQAEPLSLKDVTVRAGLGEKFLYGPKHKTTTKPAIESILRGINGRIEERRRASTEPVLTDLEQAKLEADYWKQRYEKLARYGNLWFARMREQQRMIRELQKQAGNGVVRLVGRR